MISHSRLESILAALPRLRIGLVGDLFLDRYLELAPGVHELSIETGLEAYQIPRVRNAPGALGTVMNNLAALGAGRLVPVTVLGDDGHAYDLRQALAHLPVELSHVVTDPQRLTPTYTKPMRQDDAGVWRELNRLDLRSREPLAPATVGRLIAHLRDVFYSSDGLIVLDQINEDDWGVVNAAVRQALADLAREVPEKLVFIDSRRHLGTFSCGVLKGNRAEVLSATSAPHDTSADIEAVLTSLSARTGRPVYCTAGESGIYFAEPGRRAERAPGLPVTGPVDIVGAGDAATSGIVSALLAGSSVPQAAAMGNLVASITIQQLGTTGTASPDQVRARRAEAWP